MKDCPLRNHDVAACLRHIAPVLQGPALAQRHQRIQQLSNALRAGAGEASGDVLRRGGAVEGGQGAAHGLGLFRQAVGPGPLRRTGGFPTCYKGFDVIAARARMIGFSGQRSLSLNTAVPQPGQFGSGSPQMNK